MVSRCVFSVFRLVSSVILSSEIALKAWFTPASLLLQAVQCLHIDLQLFRQGARRS